MSNANDLNTNKLLNYLPPFYNDIEEIIALTNSEDQEIQALAKRYKQILNISYLNKIQDDASLQIWQEQFGVDLSHLPFAEKKRQLLALMLGFNKLSCSKIEEITYNKTGYRSKSYIEDSKIILAFNDIGFPNEQGMKEVKDYIEQLKPAHLGLETFLLFRTHRQLQADEDGNGGITHGKLQQNAYTHVIIKTRKDDL